MLFTCACPVIGARLRLISGLQAAVTQTLSKLICRCSEPHTKSETPVSHRIYLLCLTTYQTENIFPSTREELTQSAQNVDNSVIWNCYPSFRLSTHCNLSAIESSTAGERLKGCEGSEVKARPWPLDTLQHNQDYSWGVRAERTGAATMTPPEKYRKYLF